MKARLSIDHNRLEAISGRDAMRRLANGEDLFTAAGNRYYLKDDSFKVWLQTPQSSGPVSLDVSTLLEDGWYILKPFDVRQAMLDRPNEWVGKFESGSEWWAVGFDTKHFNVIAKPIELHVPVDTDRSGMTFPRVEDLDACIPIEDVPKEANQ